MSAYNPIQHFLEASYVYYWTGIPPEITDFGYDNLCKHIERNWDKLEHPHKYLIEKDSLATGSAYYIPKDSYPEDIKNKYKED